jgi:ABC-type transporter Mla MlaB component
VVAHQPIVLFTIRGPIARADLAGLYGRVCRLLEGSRACVVYCDVEGVCADAVTVDALARLQLAARRHGCEIWVRGASAELRELIELMGLSDVLPE